jgi:hypothetical protein
VRVFFGGLLRVAGIAHLAIEDRILDVAGPVFSRVTEEVHVHRWAGHDRRANCGRT